MTIVIAFSLGVSRGRIMIIVIAFLLVIGRGDNCHCIFIGMGTYLLLCWFTTLIVDLHDALFTTTV